jgi:hypothetical protein
MRSKKNLKANYIFYFKATKMRKYNWGLKNPNKKISRGFKCNIHAQATRRGMGFWGVGTIITVATPLWGKCEDETHTPKIGTWESSGTPKISEFNCRGENTSHWVFFVPLERSWSLDVQNGLAWVIWTSTSQVMVERRAGSQTGSLTPNH